MRPLITNCWSQVTSPQAGAGSRSLVGVDLTGTPRGHSVRRSGPDAVDLLFPGFGCNFPPERIRVRDGIVRHLDVDETGCGARVRISLERPSPFDVRLSGGMPARLILAFDRAPATRSLARAVVVLDPGHGGVDAGDRGPVNLLEKDKALEIARLAAAMFEEAGASAVLTRNDDRAATERRRRAVAAAAAPDLCISVHTGGGRSERGCRALYPAGDARSRRLAECLFTSVVERVSVPGRGVRAAPRGQLAAEPWPRAFLDVAAVAHPLDEALLRDPHFKRRIARAIVLGAADFLERPEAARLA